MKQLPHESEFVAALDSVRALAKRALREWFPGGKLPLYHKDYFSVGSGFVLPVRQVSEPMWREISLRAYSLVEVSPEASALWTLFAGTIPFQRHAGRLVGSPFESRRLAQHDLLIIFLQWYLERKGSYAKDSRLLRRFYSIIFNHYSSANITRKCHMYLEGIAIKGTKITLGSIALESLPESHLEQRYNEDWTLRNYSSPPSRGSITAVRAVLVHRSEHEKVIGERSSSCAPDDIYQRFCDAVSAIRITSTVPVGASKMYSRSGLLPAYNYTTSVGSGFHNSTFCGGTIGPRASREIARTYQCIRRLRGGELQQLDIALSRLRQLDKRSSLEDRVLDLFIGLESVLIGRIERREKKKSDITSRLATLGSIYLGGNQSARDATHHALKKGYDLRSRIVHGNKRKPKSEQKLVEQLTQLYKSLLCKWVRDEASGRLANKTRRLL